MATNFGPPHMEGGTTEQLAQIRSYLHKLADELNYQFSRVERGLVHGGEGGNSGNTLEAGGNGLSTRLAITEQGLAAEVQNRQNADNALTSRIDQEAGRISAKVSERGGIYSDFSWELLSSGFLLRANGNVVFDCDSGGLDIYGRIRSVDSSALQYTTMDSSGLKVYNGVNYAQLSPSGLILVNELRGLALAVDGSGNVTLGVAGVIGSRITLSAGGDLVWDGTNLTARGFDVVTEMSGTAPYATRLEGTYHDCMMGVNHDALIPSASGTTDCGYSSRMWNDVYAVNGAISTSDARKKGNIKPLTEQHLNFVKRIAPKSFTFTDGESGRTHIGFIAQEVEEAMEECGLTSLDFAGFIKSPVYALDAEGKETDEVIDYAYGLRYTEFIALVTYAWQETDRKLDNLIDTLTQKGVI